MTIEEKAKAYYEALERAQKELAACGSMDCDAARQIFRLFPQLRESEDKKIIQFFAELATDACGGPGQEYYEELGLNYDKVMAWLEKQKKEKHATIEQVYEKFLSSDTLKSAKENKYIRAQVLWELMHNGIITEVDYQYLTDDKRKPWTAEEYRIAYQKGFEMSEQLKQKEQKPVDDKAFEGWIDGWWKHNKVSNPDSYDNGDEIQFDEKGFKNFCRGIKNMYQQKPANNYHEWRNIVYYVLKEWLGIGQYMDLSPFNDIVETLQERYSLPKSAEWSEKYIADIFEKVGLAKIVREQGNDALTNAAQSAMIELSKTGNAEWGEEDKTIINVLRLAVVNSGEALFRKHEITKQECIDFVNSLRPSWKPSKEEMEALDIACSGKLWYGDIYLEGLKRIREQLKKL